MKNFILLLLMTVLISSEIKSQSVISSSGDYFENGNISLSWTMGEPVIETVSDGSTILTQGFQQTKLSATEIYNINSEIYNINLFPNPTQDFININTSEIKKLNYNISDINGKILKEGKLISQNTEISVNDLPAAVYFFKISDHNEIIRIFKIVKQ